MRVPFDHAIDREWVYGLRSFSVQPFPISQTQAGFRSSIQKGPSGKLPKWRRWLTTYPYQVVNELSRYTSRAWSYLRARLARPAASRLLA
jgi:GR25 family glycosyltransferase involved in LPS biosynthesis